MDMPSLYKNTHEMIWNACVENWAIVNHVRLAETYWNNRDTVRNYLWEFAYRNNYAADQIHPSATVTAPDTISGITALTKALERYDTIQSKKVIFGGIRWPNPQNISWKKTILIGDTIKGDADTGYIKFYNAGQIKLPMICIGYSDSIWHKIVLQTVSNSTIYYRISSNPFNIQDTFPQWKTYSSPVITRNNYLQVRLNGTGTDSLESYLITYNDTVYTQTLKKWFEVELLNNHVLSANNNAIKYLKLTVPLSNLIRGIDKTNLNNIAVYDTTDKLLNRYIDYYDSASGNIQMMVNAPISITANKKIKLAFGSGILDDNNRDCMDSAYRPLARFSMTDTLPTNKIHNDYNRLSSSQYITRTALAYRNTGINKYAIKFNGTSSKIVNTNGGYGLTSFNLYNGLSCDKTDTLSIVAFYKRQGALGTWQSLLSTRQNKATKGWYIGWRDDNRFCISLGQDTTKDLMVSAPPNTDTANWQMVTVSYVPGADTSVKIWYNQVRQSVTVDRDNLAASATALYSTIQPYIGASYDAGYFYNGYIGGMNLFYHGLTQTDVNNFYYDAFYPDSSYRISAEHYDTLEIGALKYVQYAPIFSGPINLASTDTVTFDTSYNSTDNLTISNGINLLTGVGTIAGDINQTGGVTTLGATTANDLTVSVGNITIGGASTFSDVVFNNSGDTVFISADLHVMGTFSTASDVVFVYSNGAHIVMPDCTVGTTNGNTSVVLTYPANCTSSRRRSGLGLNTGLMIGVN